MPDVTHEGNDPMGAPTSHRGPLENCPAPDCQDRIAEQQDQTDLRNRIADAMHSELTELPVGIRRHTGLIVPPLTNAVLAVLRGLTLRELEQVYRPNTPPSRPALRGPAAETQQGTQTARCLCGAPIEWMDVDVADGSGWIHSPGSDTPCLTAIPAGAAAPGQPQRGDAFEEWLKTQRDLCEDYASTWGVVDGLLDQYRLHADTGTPLSEHVCEGQAVGDCQCLEAPAVGVQPDKEARPRKTVHGCPPGCIACATDESHDPGQDEEA